MNLKKLNGWQRLWLIGFVLWTVGTLVGLIVTGEFPTKSKLEAQFESDLEQLPRDDIRGRIYLRWEHEIKVRELWTEQPKVIGLLFLMCVAPPVGVYTFALGGWQVAVWVWHVFKLKGESE